MILKNSMNLDVRVNVYELISYKTLIIQRLNEIGKKINLNLGPKIRREFEFNYRDYIGLCEDFKDGLTYVLKNEKSIPLFKEILDNLYVIDSTIYDVLFDEELFLNAIDENILKVVKKRKKN